ncbi:MAG: tRNA (N(6)-L-threonylcarbamoyladenosine(37)-C(2))-methylthiotransferase MtaB [Ginsengibacter sp.]
MLESDGYIKKDFEDIADLYVINTCSVTENADKECRQLVRRIQKRAPGGIVVITGCYAQLKSKEIAQIEGVDLVLGAAEKFNIVSHLKDITKGDETKICSCDIDEVNNFNSSFSLQGRTRTFLKVQDGCDYTCAFCTIPRARGASRSNPIDKVLQEVDIITKNGVQEIVLTGINLGDYGKGLENEKVDFFKLIQKLENTNVKRYRISSIEPNLLTEDIIKHVARSKNFMPHFHIPLQSGSNRILGLMRRRYKKELFANRVATIKKYIPHCAIGVDVIAGFPGETEEDFMETYDFLSSLDISYLHVFTYSERDNTTAIHLPSVVPIPLRHARTKKLRALSYQKLQGFTSQNIGQTRPVLFESINKLNMMEGFTDNYIKITIPYQKDFENRITDWTI